jgi:hypothetical protein
MDIYARATAAADPITAWAVLHRGRTTPVVLDAPYSATCTADTPVAQDCPVRYV